MTKSERGILSEWRVAKDRVENHGDGLVLHRKRTPYAEIDLLFATDPSSSSSHLPRMLILIEVKSVGTRELWGADLISVRQLDRLKRARVHLSLRYRLPVRFLIAVVRTPASIQYFDIDNES